MCHVVVDVDVDVDVVVVVVVVDLRRSFYRFFFPGTFFTHFMNSILYKFGVQSSPP